MTKKLLFIIVVVLNGIKLFAYDFSAACTTIGKNNIEYRNSQTIYYNITDSVKRTVEVTYRTFDKKYELGLSDYAEWIEIPSTVEYKGTLYTITAIGDYAMNDCCLGRPMYKEPSFYKRIEHINNKLASEGISLTQQEIEAIHSDDFSDYNTLSNSREYCIGITSITIPATVTRIGRAAFKGCSNMKVIYGGSAVTQIGDYAFEDCSELYECLVSKSLKVIGNGAYSGCTNIRRAFIGDSVLSIGEGAFAYCYNLTELMHTSSVEEVCNIAFLQCFNLEKIDVPSIKSIGGAAFHHCHMLKSFNFSDSIYFIGEGAFSYSGLTSVRIPKLINRINYSFDDCPNLETVFIPSTVTYFFRSFFDCPNLKSVTCEAVEPPSSLDGAFYFYQCMEGPCIPDYISKVKLYVPCNSIEMYKTYRSWNGFGEYLPIPSSCKEK